ncbi:hypothetical protein [Aestuariivivens sp. NBU2969]|uniref:hypothetical protein n=1 Tax=Aestuariivivens sp. NBU2969 TaxID=2873267 RepID=UPI001CBB0A3A|nr:hypothetical protein [Aestuariivivens sp. NBU2969]
MERQDLIAQLTCTFLKVLNLVDRQEFKAKEIFSEDQLELIEDVWLHYSDGFEATIHDELVDWNIRFNHMTSLFNR